MDLSYLFSAGIFVQVALLFYVLGLITRNELLLQVQLLIGSVCYMIYYYFISDAPLWDAIWASAVIGVTNVVMILVILREKSTIGMTPEMIGLYQSFPTLNPGQFRKIMRQAEWVTARDDTQICTCGVRPDYLFLVSSGDVILRRDDRSVRLGAGNFIGEISFLLDGPATADVIAPKGTVIVRWERDRITRLMAKSMRFSNAVAALFNRDIAKKLSLSWPVDAQGQAVGKPARQD